MNYNIPFIFYVIVLLISDSVSGHESKGETKVTGTCNPLPVVVLHKERIERIMVLDMQTEILYQQMLDIDYDPSVISTITTFSSPFSDKQILVVMNPGYKLSQIFVLESCQFSVIIPNTDTDTEQTFFEVSFVYLLFNLFAFLLASFFYELYVSWDTRKNQ